MANTGIWNCVTCQQRIATPHCPECGDCAIDSRDLTLKHLLIETFHSLTDLDSRLLRSFRSLLFSPGGLTVAYLEGPRKPYLVPFHLFLLANVLFFAIQSISPDKIFSTPLASHLHSQDWSTAAQSMVAHRIEKKSITLEAYTPVFDQAVAVNAKSLVIAMALPFALMLIATFARSARPFATHLVFALHFYSFQLVLLCALLLTLDAGRWLSGARLPWASMDTGLFIAQLAVSAIYLYIAIGRVYHARGFWRVGKMFLLLVTVGVAVSGYRFLIFLITLCTT